ncbi:MAG TPA: hypothetical protein VII23_05010 [Terriglobales bacterium]
MLLFLRLEAELVDVLDDVAQVVAGLDLVFDLAEDFADFVLDGVGAGGLLLEAVQVRKELLVDEVAEIVADQALVVVELAGFGFGRGPGSPAVRLVEDGGVGLASKGGFGGFLLLQGVKVFQEEKPGSLLGVVELGGASGFFTQDVVNVTEGLFEHRDSLKMNLPLYNVPRSTRWKRSRRGLRWKPGLHPRWGKLLVIRT